MPYGVPNEKPEQTKWMEECVGSITGTNKRTGKPYTEDEKIAICKWNLKRHGWKVPSKSETLNLEINDGQYRRITWGPTTIN